MCRQVVQRHASRENTGVSALPELAGDQGEEQTNEMPPPQLRSKEELLMDELCRVRWQVGLVYSDSWCKALRETQGQKEKVHICA